MRKIPFHFVIFSLFPVLFLYDYNKELLEIAFVHRSMIFAILFGVTLFLLSYIALRDAKKASLFTTVNIISFLLFGNLIKIIYSPAFVSPHYYDLLTNISYSVLFLLLTISFVLILRTKNKPFLKISTRYLNVVAIILSCFSLISIGFYEIKILKNDCYQINQQQLPSPAPDIYYIILDGFGRNDVLKEIYGFDNDPFTRELENKNFYVAKKSQSNYARTYFSLSSSLNMSYVPNQMLAGGNQKQSSLKEKLKSNLVISTLKNNGYKIIATPTSWPGVQGNIKSDVIFQESTLNDFERILITTTPLRLYFNDKYFEKEHRAIMLSSFSALKEISHIQEPTFTLAHIYSLHPPFVFDEHGKSISSTCGFCETDGNLFFEGNPHKPTKEEYRNEYISQLKFISTKTLRTVSYILANSETPPIIILQSDHGLGSMFVFGDPEKTNIAERISILNTYYVPDEMKEILYDSISPVNSFRAMFNTLFNTKLGLLKDRSYFFTEVNNVQVFVDVTSQT